MDTSMPQRMVRVVVIESIITYGLQLTSVKTLIHGMVLVSEGGKGDGDPRRCGTGKDFQFIL